jgi:hypothetical protein
MTESQERAALPFARDERPTTVLLVRDADDYRAMHPMIELRRGEERAVFEVSGWRPTRPIAGILALAGFTGDAAPGGELTEAPEGTPVVPLRSFSVPDPGKLGDVQMMIRLALTGRLGGFHPVVLAQAGFHAAPWSFEYVWTAAGCPPIHVYHPEMVSGPAASAEAAGHIAPAAERNVTLAAVRALEGAKPLAGIGGAR